jgi:chromosome segregation ATPase
LDETNNKITELTGITTGLQHSFTHLSGQVEDLETARKAEVVHDKKVDTALQQLESKCDKLLKRVDQLEELVMKGEVKDRWTNLIFHGVKEKGYGPKEDSTDVVETILREKLGIQFDLDINKCYRMGSHQKAMQSQARPRPMMCGGVY